MPRTSAAISVTLAAAMLVFVAPPAWSDVLIGNYAVSSKYNTAGAPDSYPDPYNPYLYPTNLPPGPVIITGLAAGRYRLVSTGIGSSGASGVFVWLGGVVGTYFPMNSPQIVGSVTEFFYNGGNVALYWHDWYPWDNGEGYYTDVALYQVVATFQSTLQDITNLQYQGLISNKGIANSLSAKIAAGAAAAARGHEWQHQVEAFKHEVEAQAGNHLLGIAIQTLLFDADSLLSQ
jgi:hypothetical protein